MIEPLAAKIQAVRMRRVGEPALASRSSAIAAAAAMAAVLDTLPGLAYVTDADGHLLAIGSGRWRRVALRDGGAAIADARALLGTSIYAAMRGDELVRTHRRIAQQVLRSVAGHTAYRWCGDGPDIERDLRMTIDRLRLPDGRPALLYHSTVVATRRRPGAGMAATADEAGGLGAAPLPLATATSRS